MVLCSFFLSSKGFGQTSTNGGIYVTSDLVAARGDISGLWTWSEANAICNELVDNNFSDWRLPSKEELNFLYELHSHGSGNFKGMAYWSSTDVKSGFKATQFFHNGSASSGSLGGKYSVRCVRNVSSVNNNSQNQQRAPIVPTRLTISSASIEKGGIIVYKNSENYFVVAALSDLDGELFAGLAGKLKYENAFRGCDNLVLNGFSDWHLPTKEELNQLYLNKEKVGGFAFDDYYWSSTVSDYAQKSVTDGQISHEVALRLQNENHWAQHFGDQYGSSGTKQEKNNFIGYNVRCIRYAHEASPEAPTVASTPPATSSSNTRESEILYLMINKDVAKAGLNAWSHYQTFGKKEGRIWPNLTKANTPVKNEINAKLYLLINKDVAEAGLNAWNHYQVYGKNEGRIWPNLEIVPDNNPTDCSISSAIYLLLNKDVADVGLNAWSHYQNYGKKEGRIWPGCSSTF